MIAIKNLSFGYKNKKLLFDQINLNIKSGSISGLLGKNGAGKTTLLKMISGLLKPNDGEITVSKFMPRERDTHFLSDLFFVAEEFSLPSISISNHIKANSPFYSRFDFDLMDKLLVEFELPAKSRIDKMSYGQKKKYLISFALATKCRLLILDEPTNGLDISSKSTFRKVLASSLDEDQLVLISTHQVKDVENLIDSIIMVGDGKIILQKDMLDISSQLHFGQSVKLDDDIIYSEASPNGYQTIKSQVNGNSTVNLELLFNALTNGTKLFENE
ncbi:MAG: ABC transporter ATP-binding protein [Reichenbachiella sp.]